ncbi:MAG TPA: hypothetical protein VER33_15400 [Polyangiaceae bacterium]|nr:hypothetical protein [Polyangiaceae bacterium]
MSQIKQALAFLASVGCALLAACSGSETQGGTSSGPTSLTSSWTHYSSDVVEDGHPARIEYWVRGTEVVRQYWQNGALLYDERCEGKRLTISELSNLNVAGREPFKYREISDRDSPAACFDAATHEELRYLVSPEKLPAAEKVKLSDGRAALRWVEQSGHQFVVDAELGLPVRVDYGSDESDGTVSIAFGPFNVDTTATQPAAPSAEWTGYQETKDVPSEEAGRVLGLAEVPSSVAGLKLRHSWSYLTQNLSEPTYYLLWGDHAKNVQMVTTRATMPEHLRGFSPDGREYDAQDGERHVKVGTQGGSANLLLEALAVLRPSALLDVRVHNDVPPSALAE